MNFFKVEEYGDCFEIQTINGELVIEVSFKDYSVNRLLPDYLDYNQAKDISNQICRLFNNNTIKIKE